MSDAPKSSWTKNFSKSQKRWYWFCSKTGESKWIKQGEEDVSVCPGGSLGTDAKAEENPAKKRKIEDTTATTITGSSEASSSAATKDSAPAPAAEKRSVAIIVPFRDQHAQQKRKEHLDAFVPHMAKFLAKAGATDFHTYIVEQSDDGRKFNRGKLLNIGFEAAEKAGHNIFIFHDVDLLPQDQIAAWYVKYPANPFHIARCWGRYNDNRDYFGGIVSFSASDLRKINGYPNNFWGWGGEDDEMMRRVKACQLKPEAPDKDMYSNAIVDLENMGLKEKLGLLKKTDWKCNVKWELKDEHQSTWKENGLSSLKYKHIESSPIGGSCTKIVVDVLSNHHWTDDIDDWKDLTEKIAEWKAKNPPK